MATNVLLDIVYGHRVRFCEKNVEASSGSQHYAKILAMQLDAPTL